MRRLVFPAVLAAVLTFAASASARLTLITPSGKPIGGEWQRWVNEARTPTVNERVVLRFTRCPGAASGSYVVACTSANTFYSQNGYTADAGQPDTIYLVPFNDKEGDEPGDKYTLYRELGHLFDYDYLTNAGRQEFTSLWDIGPAPVGASFSAWWWNGITGSPAEIANAPGEQFADAYALCALYGRRFTAKVERQMPTLASVYGNFNTLYLGPLVLHALATEHQTCRMIDQSRTFAPAALSDLGSY